MKNARLQYLPVLDYPVLLLQKAVQVLLQEGLPGILVYLQVQTLVALPAHPQQVIYLLLLALVLCHLADPLEVQFYRLLLNNQTIQAHLQMTHHQGVLLLCPLRTVQVPLILALYLEDPLIPLFHRRILLRWR